MVLSKYYGPVKIRNPESVVDESSFSYMELYSTLIDEQIWLRHATLDFQLVLGRA